MATEITISQAVLCLCLFPLTSAVVTCPNTETNAIYHGRNHWTIPDAMTTYNDTDSASCSVFCRQDTNCKSFVVAEDTCTLYSIQVGKNTRKLVKDMKSVHFDGLQVTPRERSHFGTCSVGNLCQNGASCVNDCSDRGYSCICTERFRGINCEHGVMDRLILQSTIPIAKIYSTNHFWSNGNLYIVAASKESGLYVFKYNIQTSTSEQIQFITNSYMWESNVFTFDDDVYVALGQLYTTNLMSVFHFNKETEQFHDPSTVVCGKCTSSFLQDSRGDATFFVARYRNPDKTTHSKISSFSRHGFDNEYHLTIETNGISDSHMFEMDGSNYLVLLQSVNDAGDLKDTLIYQQRHDYGKKPTINLLPGPVM
ncbi:uncharacterized protein [Antedon mediterranea]|uniref:uncharacterized protein n=1 Tax=Antedon mediterranea TaxID=105859 RepID=UPI003AF655E1